jgi:hypothetical protein
MLYLEDTQCWIFETKKNTLVRWITLQSLNRKSRYVARKYMNLRSRRSYTIIDGLTPGRSVTRERCTMQKGKCVSKVVGY